MKYFYTILIIFFKFSLTAFAQEFGGNPPSIKWNQINTTQAQVIFPKGLDSTAIRVANIINQINQAIQTTIGNKQKKISIVLQNQTTISNAYVGLAPFRSEFYLTPEQNSFELGSLPWADQLAIHEFRHVQQYDNFNVGVSHFFKVLFGEGGQAVANSLAIPNWFFEGDAVFNETYVSEQGRGRLPYFFNGYRALWAAGKNYSWMKLRNGSLVDFVPDWYPTGYMLVAYGREKYGDDFWKNVTQDAATYKGGFYPFQRAIKKYSQKSFDQFSKEALNYFEIKFKEDVQNKPINDFIIEPKHFVANEEYPAFIGDSAIVYVKSSYSHPPEFVYKSGTSENTIAKKGISLDNYFAYNNGKIIYASYKPDIRWNYRNYSELRLLDLKTGIEKRLTKNSKLFSPAFSNDGNKIIAVEQTTDGKSKLCVLSALTGELLTIIPNKNQLLYTYPKFYNTTQIISAVRNTEGKMSVALIDIKTGEANILIPFTFQPIAFTEVKNDIVYFSATSGINDQIFSFDIKTKHLSILKNLLKFDIIGKYQMAISDKAIAIVGFSNAGYQIIELNKKDIKWEQLSNNVLPGSLPDLGINALTKGIAANLLSNLKNDTLKVSKYNKSFSLINFHSLVPNLNDPNYTINIESENILNTMQTNLSFNYNRNEGYKEFGVSSIYGALFPYIYGGFDYKIDRSGLYHAQNINWNEANINAGFEIPLNLTSGTNFTYLNIGSDLNYSKNIFQASNQFQLPNSSYSYLNNYIRFSNNSQQASQNIYPNFGQSVNFNYKSAISGLNANQFLANGNIYLPGLFVNNNFVINIAYQQHQKFQKLAFSNDFSFSRGYQAENFYQMKKTGINYHFPISYPDSGFGNLAYILRFRANIFYDYTAINDFYFNTGKPFNLNFQTIGAEFYIDTKLFNQSSVTFGLRYSYLLNRDVFGGGGHNRLELIIPVAIF